MSTRIHVLLTLIAIVAALVAITRPASAQSAAVAICTPLAIMSSDPVAADLALENAINDHLAAGRARILVQNMPPAPGPYVCGW